MTTAQVVSAFLEGRSASNGRISTDGTNLYSYVTLIAFRDGEDIYVTTDEYSATTTKHVREVHSQAGWLTTGPEVMRPISIANDRQRGWQHADERPSTYLFGRKPRKGSVGYRPVDEKETGDLATFKAVV